LVQAAQPARLPFSHWLDIGLFAAMLLAASPALKGDGTMKTLGRTLAILAAALLVVGATVAAVNYGWAESLPSDFNEVVSGEERPAGGIQSADGESQLSQHDPAEGLDGRGESSARGWAELGRAALIQAGTVAMVVVVWKVVEGALKLRRRRSSLVD
jgi:hypothetical protein